MILPKDQINPVQHLKEIANSDRFHADDPDGGLLLSTAKILELSLRATELLDSSIFYAQMYADKTLAGKALREKMISESQTIIQKLKRGNIVD